MTKQTYEVTYIELGDDYINHEPLAQRISAETNSKARQTFKDMMSEIVFAVEHKDYVILSVQLSEAPSTIYRKVD